MLEIGEHAHKAGLEAIGKLGNRALRDRDIEVRVGTSDPSCVLNRIESSAAIVCWGGSMTEGVDVARIDADRRHKAAVGVDVGCHRSDAVPERECASADDDQAHSSCQRAVNRDQESLELGSLVTFQLHRASLFDDFSNADLNDS